MVLHHVAQRAGLVVVADAILEADGLGHRDLDVIDVGGVPQRFVERVGETQRHQVLHRFLAEIVIDAEDLVLFEDLADLVVQRPGRVQVAADRLFHHDARLRGGKAMLFQLEADVAEERWRDGHVEDADALAVADRLLQRLEALARERIDRDIGKAGEESIQLLGDDVLLRHMVDDRLASELAVLLVGQLGSRRTDDAGRFGELARDLALIQCRQELALGQVAGRAEGDEVERLDGNDLARHGFVLSEASFADAII